MAILTIPQAIVNAQKAGFKGQAAQIMVAIQMCESGLNTHGPDNVNSDIWRSRDRGLNQINNHYHSEVSDACAYDALCSTQAAFRISNFGSNFSPWTTYTGGCYKNNMAQVGNAMLGLTVPSSIVQIPEWTKSFMNLTIEQAENTLRHYPTSPDIDEGGVDFSPGYGTPITALANGSVQGAGYFCKNPDNFCASSWQSCGGKDNGYGVVTTRITNSDGSQTDLYYQHIIIHPSIKLSCKGPTGQKVKQGQLIGWGNPQGYIEIGINVGTKWGGIWGGKSPGAHVDPIPYLHNLIANGGTGVVDTSSAYNNVTSIIGGFFGTDFHSISNTSHEILNNVPGFVGICEALDLIEQFQPFQFPNTANATGQAAVDAANSALGPLGPILLAPIDPLIKDIGKEFAKTIEPITLPADTMQAGIVFIVANTGAFCIRLLIIVIGFVIVTALIINMVNPGEKAQEVLPIVTAFL